MLTLKSDSWSSWTVVVAKNWGREVERWEKFLEGAAFAKTHYNDDKDDDDDDDGDGDDIYIMVKCLCVTKVIISVFKGFGCFSCF